MKTAAKIRKTLNYFNLFVDFLRPLYHQYYEIGGIFMLIFLRRVPWNAHYNRIITLSPYFIIINVQILYKSVDLTVPVYLILSAPSFNLTCK